MAPMAGIADAARSPQPPAGTAVTAWSQVRELGSGAYSRVVLALDRLTGQYLALKLVRRGPQSITKYVEREVGAA